mgnify:CR=1 FL=1
MANNALLLNEVACNGCGICVKTCPQLVFDQENKGQPPSLKAKERCYGCMACEEDCPQGAIVVHRLPAHMKLEDIPPPCQGLDEETVFDIVIIGAGPAGLGAAIRARMLDLKVLVLERLPSSKRAHHPDGGFLFATPEIYNVSYEKKFIHIKELDLKLPSSLLKERLQDFSLVGPSSQRTKRREKEWAGFPIVDKDLLVHHLALRAEELGAVLCYNTRAIGISSHRDDGLRTVTTACGKSLQAKIVISAEGISGRLTEKAGIPVNAKSLYWAISPYASFPPAEKPTSECAFIVSQGAGEESKEQIPYLRYTSSGPGGIHLAAGPVQRHKYRVPNKPATEILEKFINEGKEEQEILGRQIKLTSEQYDGCRVLVREIPKTFVGPALIAVGDAIATSTMMTNLLAIKSGDVAATVAHEAIKEKDTSANFLRRYDDIMRANQMFMGMSWMNKLLFKAPMELPLARQNELYSLLRSLCLSKVQAGELWPLFAFYLRISPTLIFDSELRSYLVP